MAPAGNYKKRFYKKKPSTSTKTIKSIVKKQITNATETKMYQIPSESKVCDTTGVVTQLANISQGDGEAERIGAQVRYKSLKIKGVGTPAAGDTTVILRMIIVKSKDGTAPTLATLMLGTNAYADQLDDSMPNFKILSDKRQLLNTGWMHNILYSANIKLDCPAQWNAAGTQTKNSIWLVTMGDTVNANAPTLTYSYTMKYSDM